MAARPGLGGLWFRTAHLAVACAAGASAYGVVALDASEWIQWLTAGGEVTASRLERVAFVLTSLASIACALAGVGLAGAIFPGTLRAAYRRMQRTARAALDGRKREQPVARVLVFTALALACLLGLAFSIHRQTGTPLSALSRDPTTVMAVDPWVGLLSNVGVVLWTAAATICFLGAVLLGDRGAARDRVGCVRACGALTALLALDDLFLLHEGVLPRVTGLPELLFVSAYPLLVLALVARYAPVLLQGDWLLALIAGALLAASLGIDAVLAAQRRAFVEDAFKLAGILVWLVFLARALRSWLASPAAADC